MQWYDVAVLIVLSMFLGAEISAFSPGRDVGFDIVVSVLCIVFLLVTL